MQGTRLASVARRLGGLAIGLAVLLTSCHQASTESTINLQVYQQWQLKPGDQVKGFTVVAGLGDISIALDGKSVYAPFAGRAQKDPKNCLIFSTPDVPAYLFRMCGLSDMRLGDRLQGESLGSGALVHFATLRKQPDGTWAIVEPDKQIIEKILTQS